MAKKKDPQEDLKVWLDNRFGEIERRISRIEDQMIMNIAPPKVVTSNGLGTIRESWLNSLKIIKNDFEGLATAEALAKNLKVNKSVASGYLSRLQSLGYVSRKYNHSKMAGRFVFALTESGEQILSSIDFES